MSRFAGVGLLTSLTASQMSSAKSSSVPVKLSGEYSNESPFRRGLSQRLDLLGRVDRDLGDAMRSVLKTTSRCSGEVEL